MRRRLSFVGTVGGALLGALLLLVSIAPARADGPHCSLKDIGQAAEDTYNDFLGSCAGQFADPAYYPMLVFAGAAITTPQGKNFCHGLEDLNQKIKDAQGQYVNLKSDAQKAWSNLPDSVKQEISGNPALKAIYGAFTDASDTDATTLIDAVSLVTCACKAVTSSGVPELGKAVGSCVDAALCYVGLESGCDCGNPPANVYLDCADIILDHTQYDTFPGNALPAASTLTQCEGSFCCYGCASYLGCVTHTICYCPAPMTFKVHQQNQQWDEYLYCACPDGSHKAGSGPLARVCLCDNSNNPTLADGSCPAPHACGCGCPGNQVATSHEKPDGTCDCSCGCAEGQTKVGISCVTPCADAAQVLLAGGACCAPSQTTSCGTCCPNGQNPAANGSCVSSIPPKPFTPLPSKRL